MRNVFSVAAIPPAAVTASQMARIAPRIVPMIRPMSPVCRAVYAVGEPGAIIALPFPAPALRRVVVHGPIGAAGHCPVVTLRVRRKRPAVGKTLEVPVRSALFTRASAAARRILAIKAG